MGCVLRGIDRVRDGYAAIVRGCCALSVLSVVLIARVPAPASARLAQRTPTGFLPEEDQGAFFVAVQLPDGASVARTRAVVRAGRGPDPQAMPQVAGRAVDRRLLAARRRRRSRNSAFVVVRLKPFADRTAAADTRAGA